MMKKKKKRINPSLQLVMQNYDIMFKATVKPLTRIKVVDNVKDVIDGDIELWNCVVKDFYKNDFVTEFSYYPYEVLGETALKLYGYIKHHKLEFHKDIFILSLTDIETALNVKQARAYEVLHELLEHKVIFKTDYKECYYINILLVFKGNIKKLIDNQLKSEKGEQKTRKES